MSGLAQVQNMLSNLRQPQSPMPSREELIRSLESIKKSIQDHTGRARGSNALRTSLLTFASLGDGATPMEFGRALDPSKDGYHAGALGSSRLSALRFAGLVRKAHFGWWVLTDEGRLDVARIQAAGTAS